MRDLGTGEAVTLHVEKVISRIDQQETQLRAWVQLSETWASDALALASDPYSLPLRGVCVGVKDLFDVEGMPTRAGSPLSSAVPAAADAACIARLRSLGAVVLGKTVTTEFGYFAPGPTRNPHDPDRTPGGSSSGSAAAVGAGTVPLALGTQTAGSLTRPASYCGVAGLVLAQGSVDLSGVAGLSESLDSLGFLTRTVEDLRYVHSVFTQAGEPGTTAVKPLTRALIWDGSDLDSLDPTMAALLTELPDLLRRAGLESSRLDWDDHVHTLAEDHVTVMSYEAYCGRKQLLEEHADELSASFRTLLETGRVTRGTEAESALVRRDRSFVALQEILGETSCVIGPAALGPAPQGLAATGSPILSRPWQMLGLPVVVVPGARTRSGLPLGVQLIGLPGREQQLFEAGERLEPLLRALPAISG